MSRTMHSQAIVPARFGRRKGQRDVVPRKQRPKIGSQRSVLGKTNLESQTFHVALFGTEVYVTVRYSPPRKVSGEQWPLVIVNIEALPLGACLMDVDTTAREICRFFNRNNHSLIPRLHIDPWDVRQWFLEHAMPQARRPVAAPVVSPRYCARCKGLMPRTYPGEDSSCINCGWVDYGARIAV